MPSAKWTGPGSEFLTIGADKHCIVQYECALCTTHFAPKPCHPTRKPKVILMKEAGPIALGFTQTEVGDGHPVSNSPRSDQSDRKSPGKIAHNVERAI